MTQTLVNDAFLDTDNGKQLRMAGNTEADLNNFYDRQWRGYKLISIVYGTKRGKQLMALLENRLLTEATFNPETAMQTSYDVATATAFAISGQHALIRQWRHAIDVIETYPTAKSYIASKTASKPKP